MPPLARILLVDDNPDDVRLVLGGLVEAGFDCTTATTAREARERLERQAFDLVVLDVLLPDGRGWDLLCEMRAQGLALPVIFASALDGVAERVRGLELGADDFVAKPFDTKELAARIQAVLRRRAEVPSIAVGDLLLDVTRRRARCDGRWVELSPREFDLLLHLARRPGEALSRGELLERVWGIAFDPGTNVVDVQVRRLRRKLGLLGPQRIETVIGVGYRLRVR
jgi:two-component system copper resistance phosphate regulon response regulator CusR